MIAAAVVNRCLAPRMRPIGCSGVSPGPLLMSGITATPVSKPERPSANLGKTSNAMATITSGFPCCCVSAVVQFDHSEGSQSPQR